MRMRTEILFLLFGVVVAACETVNPSSSPLAPSQIARPTVTPQPAPQPRPVQLAVFTDSTTGFSTSDVHDVHEQIVRFNTADELIWVADDTRFPEYIVDGNLIGYHHRLDSYFQVRFGNNNGVRRAYLTWPDRHLKGLAPTLLDLWIDERGDLRVVETSVAVP